MVVRPSSGASNAPLNNGQIDFEVVLNDPFKYITEYIKKKIRNLEKRKGKLDGYKEKLKKGESLTKDQQDAVNKFGEVNGMLVFANEIVSHITVVDGSAKKERKKRARRDQLKADSDKLELVTRALEMFTLMHLTEPDDKIVTPLRERTSFHPSPGAHLNDFAAGTAKLLINLCDEEKEQTELFINDEQGHVKYHQVTEKLELIRPKYNPVPEYADDASDYTAEVEDIDAEPTDEKPEQIEEDVELVSDGFENGIDTETSSPVEINGIEEQNGSDEDGYVSIQHTNLADQPTTTPTATTDQITDDPTDNGKDGELDDDIEFVDEPAVNSDDLVQIPTTMEFVNREVYGEEDKIKEILVEVSSGFNFLAPPDESEPESDQETELKNDLGLSFGTGVEFKGDYVETVTDETGPAGVIPDETVSYENSNYEGTNIDAIKDEPTWQQRQQGPPRQVYRSTGHTNTSYRNSQRYQRNFENRRPTASAGDQGSNGKSAMRGHSTTGQNGAPKRTNLDSRRSAKP